MKFNIEKLERAVENLRLKAEYVNAEYYYPKYIAVSKILEEALNPVELYDLDQESAKKFAELMGLDEEKAVARVEKLEDDLRYLRKERAYKGSVMICSHNTILALKYDGRVSHIITQGDNDRNLINLYEVDKHLSVPRYEPKTAKAWLKEELELNGVYEKGSEDYKEMMSHYEKYTLGVKELRDIVIADKMNALASAKRDLNVVKIAKGEVA